MVLPRHARRWAVGARADATKAWRQGCPRSGACAQCSVLVVGGAADLRETASLPRSRLGRSPRDLVPRARPGDEDGGGGALCEGDRA